MADEPGGPGAISCDIETTQVRVGGLEAWSLAVAAYGRRDHRRWAIGQSWSALVEDVTPPQVMIDGLVVCAAYPTWLRAIVDDAGEVSGRAQASG